MLRISVEKREEKRLVETAWKLAQSLPTHKTPENINREKNRKVDEDGDEKIG